MQSLSWTAVYTVQIQSSIACCLIQARQWCKLLFLLFYSLNKMHRLWFLWRRGGCQKHLVCQLLVCCCHLCCFGEQGEQLGLTKKAQMFRRPLQWEERMPRWSKTVTSNDSLLELSPRLGPRPGKIWRLLPYHLCDWRPLSGRGVRLENLTWLEFP